MDSMWRSPECRFVNGIGTLYMSVWGDNFTTASKCLLCPCLFGGKPSFCTAPPAPAFDFV